jgi:O-antigen/teichoic acid export membrane protein
MGPLTPLVEAETAPPETGWRALRRLRGSTLIRTSATYVGSNVLNRSIPFLLLPVLTRYLSPEDLGTVAMFALAVSLVVPLVGLNTEGAIGRQYFERDSIDLPNYIANCGYILIATTAAVSLAVLALGRWLGPLLAIPTGWLPVVISLAVGKFITSAVLTLWQVRNRARAYATFSFVQVVLGVGLSLYLVVALRQGWRGRVLGDAAGVAVMAVVGLAILIRGRWIRPGLDRLHLGHALRFGGGLVPHSYGAILIAATDRLLLAHLVGLGPTGLYAVGAQVAMVIGVLEHSFNQAWSPWLMAVLKRNDPRELRRVARLTRIYNIVIVALALALAAVAPWVLGFLVGPQFRGAAAFILWLALGNAFSGMYKMVVNQVFFANKTHLLAWITLGTGLVNLVLTYFLIRWNGAVGAAQGTALAFLLSYALTAWLSHRVMTAYRRQAGDARR